MSENLIEHTQIKAFFSAYEKQLYEKWANSGDMETREELYRLRVTLDAFKIHLRGYLMSDKLAEFKTGTG